MMRELIKSFVESIANGGVEVYNEFSLQHEFGFHLRRQFPFHKVQFERNVSYFFSGTRKFTKREIDISVFSPDRRELLCAIELKYPRNGQYPEQMYSFCKDIAFVEELRGSGFRQTYLVILADDHLFYEGTGEGIYGYFRAGKDLHGTVKKPTGQKDSEVHIKGHYVINWGPILGHLKYTLIDARDSR